MPNVLTYEPSKQDYEQMVFKHITQFPHCDQRILHAPSDNCEYCNAHPEWQELREAWGIAFTGHSYEVIQETDWNGEPTEKVLFPCPAELARPLDVINQWGGNRPKK